MSQLVEKLLDKSTLLGYELYNGTYYEVYQSKLINPGRLETRYYPQFDGEATGANATEKFKNALASIGVDCTWDLYGKIAYKNRNSKIEKDKDDTIGSVLEGMILNLKSAGDKSVATYSPYSYFYNEEGKSWWAEAIKGDTNQIYPVINKHAFEGEGGRTHQYNGEVANNYDTGTGLALDGKDYISGFRGLGMDLYTISFSICADQLLSPETADFVLQNVASGSSYFYAANTEDSLSDALKSIVSSMSTGATRVWFEDTMGEAYDLYIGQPKTTYADGKTPYKKGEVISDIHVYEYNLDDNGERVGAPIVRETITFADMDGDGDVDAWSDQVYNTVTGSNGAISRVYPDIWNESTNVITGKYVIYNANTTGTHNLTLDNSGRTYPLAAETFFWTIGVLGETEMVLDYPVYLTGSKEGTIDIPVGEVGVYDTNKKAIIHYVNYLGNDCEQPTVPPAFPWGRPAVGHVFYLVDENGTPLDQFGRPSSFAASQKLTTVVYENLNDGYQNNITTITASDKLAATDLGSTYQLFDPTASYTVVYNESWTNDGGKTTYVTNYGGAAYSNAANSGAAAMNGGELDLEKTVVYFALMVKTPGSGLKVDKTVEATKDANEFILTLDAYATGHEVIIANSSGNQNGTTGSVKLDDTAVMKEVLSDYVQLDEDAAVKYEVFTQDYLGDGKWGELKPFAAKVTTTPNTGRVETIEVSGFDYASEFVSEKLRNDPADAGNTAYRGRKLVLKVYIESRAGFWGGNNVPTNKTTTAMYSDGKLVKPFPEPQVNVPINVTIEAKDKTIYYNGTEYEGMDLIENVTIGGLDVTVNEDGTFTPSADWMDDFANAKWAEDSTKPNDILGNLDPEDYAYTVVVTPKKSGTKNDSANPSNIAGNVDGGEIRAEDLTADEKSASDTGHIYVLVPELTFKDSITEFDTPAEGYDFNGNDFVSTATVWKDVEGGRKAGEGIPDVDAGTVEPALTLTYTPDAEGDHGLMNGNFITDTKVNVEVSIGEQNITNLSTFHWQNCDHDVEDIQSHKGDVNSHEFWIHVDLHIVPDTVVIDYGLDVVIDVLSNDPRKDTIVPVLNGITAKDGTVFGMAAVNGTYGALSIDEGNVRYALNTSNGMEMKAEEIFQYQAKYTIKGKEVLASSTVTVIPATTIYYEDSFVTYSVWNVSDDERNTVAANQWKPTVEVSDADQAQDRPGTNLPAVDANNIYGYDGAYTQMETHSMGSAMKFTANNEVYGEAQFTFWGTGFDIVSLTSNTTGTVTVAVYKAEYFENTGYLADSKNYMVDTYYGYKYVLCNVTYEYEVNPDTTGQWVKLVDGVAEEGAVEAKATLPGNPKNGERISAVEYAWIVDESASDTLYQIPVMKVDGLDYDRYTVVITVLYKSALDHQKDDSYDFYLDAIRIYDPANDGANSGTIKDAYVADGEGWPEYFELRNLIISKNDFHNQLNGTGSGIVFIDNTVDAEKNVTYTISDYTNYGPNNELYLAPGQSVAFDLAVPGDVAGIHLAMKSVNGTAKVKVYDASDNTLTSVTPETIETATDLYYDITSLNNKTVVITNTGDSGEGIVSITNVKVTYKAEHSDSIEAGYFTISENTAAQAVMSLRRMSAPSVPDETLPEEPVPETTTPEDPTEPEESVPEDPTEPEEPDQTDVFEPGRFSVQISDTNVKVGSKVTVTVTTSTDVDYITVNGTMVTKYTGSRFSKTRTWKLQLNAAEAGKMEVAVVCYDKAELASEPVVKNVTVTEKYTSVQDVVRDLIIGIFDRFWSGR